PKKTPAPSNKKRITTNEDNNYYRQIPITEFFYGYNSSGKQDTLLVVYQPNDKSLAREYFWKNPFWACIGCKELDEKVYIRINNKEVFAPLKHYCQPRKIEEILKDQTEYQNLFIYGDAQNLEPEANFYSSSAEFDKFDSTEYKFGMNNVKRPNSRVIVSKKENPEYVYHYQKHSKRWICCGCFKITA
uniref:Uncharacterized protein n=1 Tax=Panagrolaimus sp. PS1159 TaxID=55785 RepID=A0AC35FW42_9BILA